MQNMKIMRNSQSRMQSIASSRVGAIRTFHLLAAFATMALLMACASSSMAPSDAGTTRDTTAGKVLVDTRGMTLYTYDKDEPGISHCYGLCAVFWPPVSAGEAATTKNAFTVIPREGGSDQWAHLGKPLYTYLLDDQPGDIKGNGVDSVWHVAKP